MSDYTFANLMVDHPDEDGILTIAINRPAAKNALDTATLQQLGECVDRARDDGAVKALVITGNGKTFGIGADIPEIVANASPEDTETMVRCGQAVLTKLERCGKPSCAAINGVFCLGGSLETAMACTFRVANKKARMGLPEITLGVIPGYGGTQRLPRLIGKARALEMILTGETVRAEEAKAIGLVHRICEPGESLSEAKALLKGVLAVAPLAVKAAIHAIHEGYDQDLDDGLRIEADQFKALRSSKDAAEGLNAQQEGRKPEFKGE